MRIRLIFVLIFLLAIANFSTANPGGVGDGIRSMECGGSCHGDPGLNGLSPASIELEIEPEIWAEMLTTVTIHVNNSQPSDTRIVGAFLLINEDGAKDTPSHDGWGIVAGPNGGNGNYAEMTSPYSSDAVEFVWTLRAPVAGQYDLLASIHHGSEEGELAYQGRSQSISVTVQTPPEDLPRLADNYAPPTVREIGEETTVNLETENVDSFTVEYRVDDGNIISAPVVDGKFTLPAAINAGVVEWRAHLEGEGPDQSTPWFRLVAEEPAWEIDDTALYFQAFALFFLCIGLLQLQTTKKEESKEYDLTEEVLAAAIPAISSEIPTVIEVEEGPPLPSSGLPQGWTMEQWNHYGQEYLNNLEGGGLQ